MGIMRHHWPLHKGHVKRMSVLRIIDFRYRIQWEMEVLKGQRIDKTYPLKTEQRLNPNNGIAELDDNKLNNFNIDVYKRQTMNFSVFTLFIDSSTETIMGLKH